MGDRPKNRCARWSARAAVTVVLVALAACGGDASHDQSSPTGSGGGGTGAATADRPLVVVTYSILGDIVRQIVGESATVEVVIPNGQDPHEFSASAHDVEEMSHARLVVANGLGLEEGLVQALDQVEADGAPVFRASDHVTVRTIGPDEPSDEHGDGQDPHLWTDPLTIAQLAPALGDALGAATGVDLTASVAAFVQEMHDLDAHVRQIMSVIPAGRCVLVTGHDSLGYFADRYGCTVIGAIVPSLSSTAEASAKDLADLHDKVERTGVPAIFTETGTPKQVAEQVAHDAGVALVQLPSHALPDTGGYQAFIVDLATRIAGAMAPA